jgi:hypothetical protein
MFRTVVCRAELAERLLHLLARRFFRMSSSSVCYRFTQGHDPIEIGTPATAPS